MKVIDMVLIIHIVSGFTALFCGLLAIIFKKGRKAHSTSGRIYYFGMLGVFVTSTLMFLIEGDRLLFLFLVGILSFYLVYTGARVIKVKNVSENVKWIDFAITSLTFSAGLLMIALSFFKGLSNGSSMGVLLLLFGLLTVLFTFQDLKYFQNIKTIKVKIERSIILHIVRMGGGYIATVTAFLVTNVHFLHPIVIWVAPGIIGGVIINRVKRGILHRKKTKGVAFA